MKPFRLKKDDVVHTLHTSVDRVRLATGADVQKTLANPTGFGWPSCWVCTEKRMRELKDGKLVGAFGEARWVPVEAYNIVDERENEEDLRAECSHGNPDGRWYSETKVLSMPRTWGKLKKAHKRSALVFFAESAGVPLGGNVVLV